VRQRAKIQGQEMKKDRRESLSFDFELLETAVSNLPLHILHAV
jgi:hypothetical protein